MFLRDIKSIENVRQIKKNAFNNLHVKIVDGIKITKIINYIIVELKFEIRFVSKQITFFDTSTAYTIIF